MRASVELLSSSSVALRSNRMMACLQEAKGPLALTTYINSVTAETNVRDKCASAGLIIVNSNAVADILGRQIARVHFVSKDIFGLHVRLRENNWQTHITLRDNQINKIAQLF